MTPSVVIPSATTQQRPFSSIPSSISTARRRSASGAAHQLDQVLARARRRTRATTADFEVDALRVEHVLADRLARAREAARRDAGEHLLEHHPRQRVAVGEVRIGRQRHLALAVGGPGPRPLDRDAPAAERDLAGLVAVTHRGAVRVVLALRADDLVDLLLHQLGQHAEPDADAQRQQPLLRRPDQLAQRLLHTRGQHGLLRGHGGRDRYGLLHGGSSFDLGGSPRTLPTGADEAEGPPSSSSTSYGTSSWAGT